MYGYKLGDFHGNYMGPDYLYLGAVGQQLENLDSGVGLCIGPFCEKNAMFNTVNHLPFQNATLIKSLGRVLPDNVSAGSNQRTNCLEQAPRRHDRERVILAA